MAFIENRKLPEVKQVKKDEWRVYSWSSGKRKLVATLIQEDLTEDYVRGYAEALDSTLWAA